MFFERSGRPELTVETVEVLLHEAFHQWLDLHIAAAPTWFNEGMAEFFAIGGKISRKSLEFGNVPTRHPSRLDNIRSALGGSLSKPWPLSRLLLADHSSFMETHGAVNYAHSWSFVHYLGMHPGRRKLLVRYFKELVGGADQQAAFDAVFGALDLKKIEQDWRAYVLGLK